MDQLPRETALAIVRHHLEFLHQNYPVEYGFEPHPDDTMPAAAVPEPVEPRWQLRLMLDQLSLADRSEDDTREAVAECVSWLTGLLPDGWTDQMIAKTLRLVARREMRVEAAYGPWVCHMGEARIAAPA